MDRHHSTSLKGEQTTHELLDLAQIDKRSQRQCKDLFKIVSKAPITSFSHSHTVVTAMATERNRDRLNELRGLRSLSAQRELELGETVPDAMVKHS